MHIQNVVFLYGTLYNIPKVHIYSMSNVYNDYLNFIYMNAPI
jgi:hypothetical protein